MSGSIATNESSPKAFLISATLHGLAAALLIYFTYAARESAVDKPKIFELVAGAGDNYAATEAPALGTPNGIKLEIPEPPAASPAPEPPMPEPSPVAPLPPEPVVESPVAPKPVPVKPVPAPPKPVNMAKLVTRIADKRAANIEKKFKAEQERAAKEAALNAKRMTKEEFDRLNKGGGASSQKPGAIRTAKIDAEGIAGGVVGGSTNNKTGGAGGKALTREEMDLSDAYIALLMQRLREAHRKPEGLSDLLQTKVEFRLNANGTLSGVNIIRSSGNSEYDASVMAAFRNIRLPAPPKLKTYIYSVTFKMKEDE